MGTIIPVQYDVAMDMQYIIQHYVYYSCLRLFIIFLYCLKTTFYYHIHLNNKLIFTHRLFTKMPSEHYMEEAQMILSVAAEDFPKAGEVRVILKVSKHIPNYI